jgi:hypothetical protein
VATFFYLIARAYGITRLTKDGSKGITCHGLRQKAANRRFGRS